MTRRIGFVVAWVLATFATGLLAWGAVRIADSQVSDTAVRPLSAAEVAALPTVPTVPPAPVTTTAPAPSGAGAAAPAGEDVVGPEPRPPPTSVPAPPPTGAVTPPPSAPPSSARPSTSTSSPPTSSPAGTTTSAPASPEVKTYVTGGGSVTIVVSPGVVELGGATPAAGYSVDVEKDGPDEVRVKFEAAGGGEDHEFSAEWEGGRLVVEID